MKHFDGEALRGLITVVATAGVFAYAFLVNRFARPFNPSTNVQAGDGLREARVTFAKKHKGLREALTSAGLTEGIAQLDAFDKKRATLIDVLDTRFAPDDLNKDRYMAIAESVRAGLLSNLDSQLRQHRSIAGIDKDELKRRIASAESATDYEHLALLSLRQQLQHVEQVHRNIGLLGVANEEALTSLDTGIVELSLLDLGAQDSFSVLEGAIAKLEKLIAQAHHASVQPRVLPESGEFQRPSESG